MKHVPPPVLAPPKVEPKKPKVLLALDQRGWAFENICTQITKHLSHKYDLRTELYKATTSKKVDLALLMWWGSLFHVVPNVRPQRLGLCIFDRVSYRAAKRQPRFRTATSIASGIIAGNEQIAADLEHTGVPIFVAEDGVDLARFALQPPPGAFTAAWTGNSACGGPGTDLKGLLIIRQACLMAGVPLVVQDAATSPVKPHSEMPDFYRQASVYLCASSSEGTPNPVLEAMAMGRPVISTDVGIVRKVVSPATGRIVERTPEAFAAALAELRDKNLAQMGRDARKAVEGFAWADKIKGWERAIDGLLLTQANAKARKRGVGGIAPTQPLEAAR